MKTFIPGAKISWHVICQVSFYPFRVNGKALGLVYSISLQLGCESTARDVDMAPNIKKLEYLAL
jgi:hypothetical protein